MTIERSRFARLRTLEVAEAEDAQAILHADDDHVAARCEVSTAVERFFGAFVDPATAVDPDHDGSPSIVGRWGPDVEGEAVFALISVERAGACLCGLRAGWPELAGVHGAVPGVDRDGRIESKVADRRLCERKAEERNDALLGHHAVCYAEGGVGAGDRGRVARPAAA